MGLEEAVAGRGGLFRIVGEPGIGKSRLAEEFVRKASDHGARCLWGRSWEGEGAPAYWPWTQILRGLAAGIDRVDLLRGLDDRLGDLARLVPELRGHVDASSMDEASIESTTARPRLFDAVGVLLRNAAAVSHPLVVVIDDVQWADPGSLLLLRFVASELSTLPMLLLAVSREAEPGIAPEVAETIALLARHGRTIPLRGLSAQEVSVLVEQTANMTVSARWGERVHNASQGNPFFVDEIVRVLAAEGSLAGSEAGAPPEHLPLPAAVRATVRRRVALAGPECADILSAASAFGPDFDLAPLAEVVARPSDEVLELLAGARAAGLVRENGLLGRFRFAHDLVRQSLYDAIPSEARLELHRQIGEALERIHAADPGPHLGLLARHFFGAALHGGAEKAVEYSTRAGEQALAAFSYEEAALHFERALQALRVTGGGERRRCELLLSLGDARSRAGQLADARKGFEAAAELARGLAWAEGLARAALGFSGFVDPPAGTVDEQSVRLLEEANQALEGRDSALRVRVLARLAYELQYGSLDRSRSSGKEAIEIARRLGERVTLARALDARHNSLLGPDDLEERVALGIELLEVAHEGGDPETILGAHQRRVNDLLELGRIRDLDIVIDAHGRLAERIRLPGSNYWTAVWRSMRAMLEGDLMAAERLTARAMELGDLAEEPNARLICSMQVALIGRERGEGELVVESVRRFAEQYPQFPGIRAFLAVIYADLGRMHEARSHLELLAGARFADFPRDAVWMTTMCWCATLCARLGDRDRAEAVYAHFLPFADRNVILADAFACAGSAAGYLGLLASTMGRFDEAKRHFEDALARNREMGARGWTTFTQINYAEMLLVRGVPGDREEAARLLDETTSTATELGLKLLLGRTDSLRAKMSRAAEATPATGGNLLRREGEYWTLAFEGTSFRLKHLRGLDLIAQLLRNPGSEVHVMDLSGAGLDHAASDAGAVLDAKARAQYRGRLEELKEELEEAERLNDRGRSERAREEIEIIGGELASAVGLGGRDRKAASAVERARANVTVAIKLALQKIAESHPSLGHHLSTTIKTGTFCCYVPNPKHPVSWEL